MSNFGTRKNANVRLTRQNQMNNVVRKTSNLDGTDRKTKTPFKTKETTNGTSKSKKLGLESSAEQLEILSVKENYGQIIIEFRVPSTIAGTDHVNRAVRDKLPEIKVEDEIEFGEPSVSVQSIPTIDHYRTGHGGPIAIKVEDEVHIEIEDEMKFCSQSSTAQLIPGTDDEEHNNPSTQNQFAENMCDICSKIFSKKSNLTQHQRRHGQPKFRCNVCGVVKFTQRDLKGHITAHHTNRINFSCDICSKTYSNKSNLVRHQRLHGELEFVCKFCGVPKSSNWHLNRHMKVHALENN